MKNLIYILFMVIFTSSCEKETVKKIREDENKNIEAFIASTKLKYEQLTGDLYKLTISEVPEETNSVQNNDSVYINYIMSEFSTTGRGGIIDTNIKEVAIDAGITIFEEKFAPLGIKYGKTNLIEGVDIALKNSMNKGMYSIIIPFDFGYGTRYNGLVEPYTTLYFEYEVINIIKKQ